MTLKSILTSTAAAALLAGSVGVAAAAGADDGKSTAPPATGASDSTMPSTAAPTTDDKSGTMGGGSAASGSPTGTTGSASGTGSATTGATADAPVGQLMAVADDERQVEIYGRKVGEIVGMDVYGSDGEEIGEVTDVLADSSGEVKGLAIDVGGFLGIGAKTVLLPLDQVQVEADRFTTTMSNAAIEALPEYKVVKEEKKSMQ
jgi:sporulation protein YlmC with PRC-barrel domain